MKTSVSEPQSWKRLVNVEIPTDEVEKTFGEKLKTYCKKAKIPGFRPGKASPAVIKTRFGDSIRAEIIEELIQKSYTDACAENNIVPVAQPKINDLKADENGPITFTIETEVDPAIVIKGYDKLKAKITPAKVKTAEVDKVIEDLRERTATFEDAERASKKGDFLTIEYQKVIVDGQERTDVSSPTYPIELGASKIKEFDKALAGREAGSVVTAAITFPKDYGDAEIAGKSGEFTIKITKVQQRILPDVNEEFCEKMGDFADETALRSQILQDLEKRELEKAKSAAIDKAVDQLIKSNPFDVPPARVTAYLGYMKEQMERYADNGRPVPSEAEIDSQYRESGVRTIKRQRIVDFIAEKEGIKATQEEVDTEIGVMAERYGRPFDEVKQALRKNGTSMRIRDDIRERKTLDFLIGEYQKPEEKQ